jgi:hypothetical protein
MFADEHKIPIVWMGLGCRGRCLVQLGRTQDEAELIARGHELARATGTVSYLPFWLADAADVYGTDGQAGTGFSKRGEAETTLRCIGCVGSCSA